MTAGIVLLLIALVAGVFSWDRWLRYDDAAEFQGEWQTHGTTAVVVIDGERIRLSEDVAYSYTLDTSAKTIAFTFGNMEGAGRYRFSLDRSQLVITDGDGFTGTSTLLDDIAWQFDQLVRALSGQPASEPSVGDGVTVLDRLSHDAGATPKTGSATTTPSEATPEPTSESGSDSTSKPQPAPEQTSEPEPQSTPAPDSSSSSSTGVFDVSDLPA